MKNLITITLLFVSILTWGQNETQKNDTLYQIDKTEGGVLKGKIISKDEREILFQTSDNRKIYIPQHSISKITPIKKEHLNKNGVHVGEDKFATRYFFSTNGLPVKKGEHYVQWNLYGPDFQFGLGHNIGVGVMTSWIGMPIIGSIKKSWQFDNVQFAIGGLAGTGSWAAPDWGMALPFASISFGDRRSNLAISGGYGGYTADGESSGRSMVSVAGMTKITPKISLVFDSFILPKDSDNNLYAIIIPGLRWHQSEGKAFQFGFTGVFTGDELTPLAIPTVQWYRSL